MKHIVLKKAFFLFSLFFFFSSCSNAKVKTNNDFSSDVEYFQALRSLSKNNVKDARVRLNRAVKKGSPLVVRRSAEALCQWGDVQQKLEGAKKLLEKYDDEDAALIACRVFSSQKEYSKILQATEKINILESNDELAAMRLLAMKEKNIQGFTEKLISWYLEKPISKEHIKQWTDFSNNEKLAKNIQSLINFRFDVYKKDYHSAFDKLSDLEEFYFTDQIMSDIGKTHLYASGDVLESALWWTDMAEKCLGSSKEFYCWFYAARMYDKVGSFSSKVAECYEKAINCTDILQKKDNALWYLLRARLKESPQICVDSVISYMTSLGDPFYYDDFFDLLSQILISEGYYSEIGNLYKLMKGNATDESTAKFAYIYARLIQEKIYLPGEEELNGKSIDEEIVDALYVALDSGTDMYYKVQATEKLMLNDFSKEEKLCAPRRKVFSDSSKINPDADRLLSGYASFGFPEKIYSEWVKLGQPLLSEETTKNICHLLQKCSNGKDDYYPQSLRMASRYANYSPLPASKDLLSYSFPKCFGALISKYSEQNKIPSEVLFALIRSESFFDADIESSAGAVGLCQLMKFTAQDVAGKLKISEYDLTDAETNIKFGAWYLANLISRLEGNYLDAFYAYNAGIARVRKWKQSSSYGLGLKEIPEDLFLETLPYTETREYGRKLVSATEMYRWLYNKE